MPLRVDFTPCGPEELGRSGFRDLVALAMREPDAAAIDSFVEGIDPARTRVYGAVSDGSLVGQLTVSRGAEADAPAGDAVIEAVSVRESWQGRGVGRFLVTEYGTRNPGVALHAEADDDAVGFYHAMGFRLRSRGEPSPDRVRYDCVFDDRDVDPLPYGEAVAACAATGIPCWVCGGWALDLFHGRKTREHEDTDILIRREDQERLFDAFPGWEIYRTHAPGLGHWNGVPTLDTASNVWLRRSEDSPWGLEVMFMDERDDEWVYRRNPAIHGRLAEMGFVTDGGIPCLRPEIQLLYKGGSSVRRRKDTDDLLRVLPLLPPEAKAWLAHALGTQFPGGHEWLRYLDEPPGGAE